MWAQRRWRGLLAVVVIAAMAFVVPGSVPAAEVYAVGFVSGDGAPTAVYRWWHGPDKDWVSIPAHGSQPGDATMAANGYVKFGTAQYYVSMIGTPGADMAAVYRWWHAGDRDWVDVREGSLSDSALVNAGYADKTFQFYAYAVPGAGRVALNRWWHAGDQDWVTIGQDEIPDATMTAWGYTGKNVVAYAAAVQSPNGTMGYFELGTPQSAVVADFLPSGNEPHTMSVLEVNPLGKPSINNGYRYLGHFGHTNCGGIYLARANDLDAASWQPDPVAASFSTPQPPCRWASTLIDGNAIRLVVNHEWNVSITAQTSLDGLNGKVFGPATVMVSEPGKGNGNPTLFRDPITNQFHLYWYRENTDVSPKRYEIRVKSSPDFDGLLGLGPTDIGQLVAYSPEVVAAPHVFYAAGKYHLLVETFEGEPSAPRIWKTRVLTGASATGQFFEIPGGPVYGPGVACAFQHVVDNTLHSWYCRLNNPNDPNTWTLDHVKGDLLSPT